MLKAILIEDLQKSCRNLKASHLRTVRKTQRVAHKVLRRFYVPISDKTPGDNFPKEPMGIR